MVVDTELARDSGALARWKQMARNSGALARWKQMARDSGALARWKEMARDSGALVPFVKQSENCFKSKEDDVYFPYGMIYQLLY